MGKADRASGIFWFLFSLFITYKSYKLGLGILHQPGPGFLFFWTGIVVAILSITVIVRSFRKQPADEAKEPLPIKWNVTKIILVLIFLFLYAMFMEKLGFLIVTLLFFILLLGLIEKKKWSLAILVSLIVTITTYLIFEVALQSQLPKGLLEFLRF